MILTKDQYDALRNLGGGWPPQPPAYFDQLFPAVYDTVRQLYVDPVNGADTNDGLTTATAVATIQRAVLMFKQPWNPATWDAGDDRTITVVHSAGLIVEEYVVIPPHAGQGALIIEGQEEVIHAGLIVDNPAFTTLSGFIVRRRLNFTTSPMTVSALADNAFVRGPIAVGELIYDQTYNNLPIVDNAAGTVDVVATDPGLISAFNIVAGASVDIVRPQTTWRPPETPASAFAGPVAIVNLGGPLAVRGFFCEPQNAGSFSQSTFLENAVPLGNCIANMQGLTRCHVRNLSTTRVFQQVFAGAGAYANGNIFSAPSNSVISLGMGLPSLSVTNLRGVGGGFNIEGCQAALFGIDWEELSTGVANMQLISSNVERLYADIRNGASLLVDRQSKCTLTALSIEGATQNALQILNGSYAAGIGSSIQGSTGNTAHGAFVGDQSLLQITNKAAPTLAGASGQLKVGNNAAQLWNAGVATDGTVNLARYA